ncbi:MAG: isopeptide-forming domain-containing fimbrial protein [Ruminococcus sp.]|nr:isopeptide-forming domain-containing fimbrial protein [Ruminococcus sp.]
MKNTKKLAAMIAALTLSACSIAPMFSFAEDEDIKSPVIDMEEGGEEETPETPTTPTVALEAGKIKFTGETAGTHSYSVYKIFAGEAKENGMNPVTGAELNDLEWAVSADVQNELVTALKANDVLASKFEAFTTAPSVADFAAVVSGLEANSTEAKAFAETVVRVFKQNNVTTTATGNGAGITLADDGYYVIAETDITDNGTEYTGMTTYLLGVYDASAGAVVTVKSDVPSFQKKLKDINDSVANSETDWQDSADYDIGDAVPFQLKATLPSNYNDYKAYKLAFHDNFRTTKKTVEGVETDVEVFNFKEITALYVDTNNNGVYDADDVNLKEKYSKADSSVNGYDFDVTITDLKDDYTTLGEDGAAVIVEYTATLNEDAVIGSAGNWNDAYLSYTTNPNWNGEGDKEEEEKPKDSPVDTTVVFTYQTVIDKVNPQGESLDGANFVLAKKYATAPEGGTELKVGEGEDAVTYAGYYTVKEIKDLDKSEFEFKGLDDGDYILVETKAPDNYKIATKPVYFTITADHTNDPATLELTSLTGAGTTSEDSDFDNGIINLQKIGNTEDRIASDKDAGTITAGFINTSGAELPSTGGIGTTLFYLGGGAMVAVAGVFLITKKRMGKSEN